MVYVAIARRSAGAYLLSVSGKNVLILIETRTNEVYSRQQAQDGPKCSKNCGVETGGKTEHSKGWR